MRNKSIEILCKDCKHHYMFAADDGTLLDEGCHLDLPLFSNNKSIVCNSYRRC